MKKKRRDGKYPFYNVRDATINGISFTPCEIDILAFLLSGRTSKTIASVLGIAKCTVETHIRNIMRKIKCNSRESIRDFLEKTPQAPFLRQHYDSLLNTGQSEEQRYNSPSMTNKKAPICCIVYDQESEEALPLMHVLDHSLKSLGVKTRIISRQKHPDLAQLIDALEG